MGGWLISAVGVSMNLAMANVNLAEPEFRDVSASRKAFRDQFEAISMPAVLCGSFAVV
jgi:hypothetical protein